MKRHHWLLLAAVALFATGWLVWNVLLVEQDVGAPRGESAVAGSARA